MYCENRYGSGIRIGSMRFIKAGSDEEAIDKLSEKVTVQSFWNDVNPGHCNIEIDGQRFALWNLKIYQLSDGEAGPRLVKYKIDKQGHNDVRLYK